MDTGLSRPDVSSQNSNHAIRTVLFGCTRNSRGPNSTTGPPFLERRGSPLDRSTSGHHPVRPGRLGPLDDAAHAVGRSHSSRSSPLRVERLRRPNHATRFLDNHAEAPLKPSGCVNTSIFL